MVRLILKWDYNRNWSEPGWPAVSPDMEKNVYVDYMENVYSILRALRAKYPKLEIESCLAEAEGWIWASWA